MNCAYIFSGQPIFNDEILNYNINYQISSKDKVCAHLWWDNSYCDKIYKLWFTDKYKEKNLDKKFIKNYNVTDYLIEKHKNFDITFCKKFNFDTWDNSVQHYKIITPILLYSFLSQSYSNYQAFIQTQKYNIDLIIRSRSDVILTNKLKEKLIDINVEENTIYFQSSMNGGHLYAGEFSNRPCDWFFLGTPNSMQKYCYAWYNSQKEEQKNGIIHNYQYIYNICKANNLNIVLIDFGAIIYKQATNWYYQYKIDPSFYVNNFDYNECKPLQNDMWPYWVENVNFEHFKNFDIKNKTF